ncbi:MAG: AAC(3) family N-acetyltransferase [Candidatus Dormiibacterota bacterium]
MNAEIVESLAQDWRGAGLHQGDMVLVHSSLRRTVKRCVGSEKSDVAAEILASFQRAVGDAGTLLFPLFNFQFTEGVPFDMRTTPSQMGLLTETARQITGAIRTGHPIYSFAVIGARAGEFSGIDNFSGYGADSPFGKLRALGGRIAVLDLPDQHSMTYYHHVEEMSGVPYRYHKTFAGEYTDMSGVRSHRQYGLFVRDIERGVKTDVDPMGELLWNQSLYSGDRPGQGCGLRVIDADPMFKAVERVIHDGRAEGLLYRIAHDN